MEKREILILKRELYDLFLSFIEDETESDESFLNLLTFIENKKIGENEDILKSFLLLIEHVSENHHRSSTYFAKINLILTILENDIKHFSDKLGLIYIFLDSPPILLFLCQNNLITFDSNTMMIVNSTYLYPELRSLMSDSEKKFKEKYIRENITDNFADFEEKRKLGENHSYIAQLIRNDSIKEFVVYAHETKLNLSRKIDFSALEVNQFMKYKQITLIEYSAFFGSIKIFNYLEHKGVRLTPSLWLYAIHSGNQHIIHILEENMVEPRDQTYLECLIEAIKCHHNHLADYFIKNYIDQYEFDQRIFNVAISSLNYYYFLNESTIDSFVLLQCCAQNENEFVKDLLKNKDLNVNIKVISITL